MSRIQSSASDEREREWAEQFRRRGFDVRRVSDAEYKKLAEHTERMRRAEHEAIMAQQPPLQPVEVNVANIPPEGQKVFFRLGECFGDDMEWDVVQEGLLVVEPLCNPNNEPGIAIRTLDGSDTGWGYAGYERDTKTWWRYGCEAKPGSYREHCMQVVELT